MLLLVQLAMKINAEKLDDVKEEIKFFVPHLSCFQTFTVGYKIKTLVHRVDLDAISPHSNWCDCHCFLLSSEYLFLFQIIRFIPLS